MNQHNYTKFYLWTIGCQQNEYESKRLNYALEQNGFISTEPENARYIIITACSVRQTAVDRILGKMKVWDNKKIIVTGCVLSADINKLRKKGVTICRDTDYKCLAKEVGIKNTVKFLNDLECGKVASNFVPIMYGCDNFCSYCAVPYTRGRERSRNFNEIVAEVEKLISSGSREVTLLGQNVNSYKYDFSKLLKTLNNLKGDFSISFTSNHPKDMSDEIIESVSALSKVKKEIHLPLQSGSDRILKEMNRPYTVAQYLEIINKIREANSKIKITTDVIVGFPGETEEDFQKTVAIFKKIPYSQAYINKYSPRAGTNAFKLGDPIAWSEKQRRWKVLNEVLGHKAK